MDLDLSNVHDDGQLRTWVLQVTIHANHQNGKDTHVRGLQIFAREDVVPPHADDEDLMTELKFLSPRLLEELEIR